MENRKKKISRKQFIANLGWLVAIPYMLFAGLSFKQSARVNRAKSIRIPLEVNNGVTFRDELIVVKDNNSVQFLSSKCTHLGCRIYSLDENELVCPCHGSRFSLDGQCVKGPAKEPLQKLDFKIDEINKEYLINT